MQFWTVVFVLGGFSLFTIETLLHWLPRLSWLAIADCSSTVSSVLLTHNHLSCFSKGEEGHKDGTVQKCRNGQNTAGKRLSP